MAKTYLKFKEINLEEGYPTSILAINHLKEILVNEKKNKLECLLIIHGYGSSYKGGSIRKKVRELLNAKKRNNEIKDFINGEDFNIFNFKALELKFKYKQLEDLFKTLNYGVTVVLL